MLRRIAGIAVLVLLVSTSARAARDEVSVRKWRDDLTYLKAQIERVHPKPYHDVSEAAFQKRLDAISAELPQLSDEQIVVRLMAAMNLGPRDGHTGLNPFQRALGYRPVPLVFHLFSDGVYLKAAPVGLRDAVGARLIAVDGTPVDDVLRRIFEIVSGDNDMTRKAWSPGALAMPPILRGLGIAKGELPEYLLRKSDGTEIRIRPEPLNVPPDQVKWLDARETLGTSGKPVPLYLRFASSNPFDAHSIGKNYWFEYLADRKLLYVNYSAVANAADESIADFFTRVFAFAKANPVEKFVIDIRNNGGGNNYLNRPIFYGMIRNDDTIGRAGRFFVITGRTTFSAAQNLANSLDNHTAAIFVGEPTGGSPNHWGDTTAVRLPNAGIDVRVATLWWQDMDPRDTRVWIPPDIAAELSFADYIAGIDPALDAVLAFKDEEGLVARVREAALRGSKEDALARIKAWVADPRRKYLAPESDINRLGYALVTEKKLDPALLVFQVNAEAFPESWNVWDSLGDAYEHLGRKAEALAAYQKAVALNPSAGSALAALERLKGRNSS
jgi:hypothetical protein